MARLRKIDLRCEWLVDFGLCDQPATVALWENPGSSADIQEALAGVYCARHGKEALQARREALRRRRVPPRQPRHPSSRIRPGG
jgi:hypothetical protein